MTSTVAIAGAGPTGLALTLARYGLRSTVFEKNAAPAPVDEEAAVRRGTGDVTQATMGAGKATATLDARIRR